MGDTMKFVPSDSLGNIGAIGACLIVRGAMITLPSILMDNDLSLLSMGGVVLGIFLMMFDFMIQT
jgi:hypothetical protein